MKILLVTDNSPHFVIEKAAHGLAERGHNVKIISTTLEKNKTEIINENGYEHEILFATLNKYLQSWQCIYNKPLLNKFKNILQDFKPDIVHFHNVHYYFSYSALSVAQQFTKKIFFTFHSTVVFSEYKFSAFVDFNQPKIQNSFNYKINNFKKILRDLRAGNPLKSFLIKKYLKKTKQMFGVSEQLCKALTENGICPISTLYNGLDVQEYEVNEKDKQTFLNQHNLNGKKLILFGGRINSLKGIFYLLDAFNEVTLKRPDAHLLIIGSGDKASENLMIKKISKYSINDKVTHINWMPHHDFTIALAASDLITVPSVYLDPCPTITLEAMAAAKPVIGSCFGGNPEMITDGLNGFMVNPIDKKIFTEKILNLLSDHDLSKQFGENGNRIIKNKFNILDHVDSLERFYA